MKYRLYISFAERGSFTVKHANFRSLNLDEVMKEVRSAIVSGYTIISVQFFENNIQELNTKINANTNKTV